MRLCQMCNKPLKYQKKYCSYECANKSPERSRLIRVAKLSDKNPNWKGDEVKYKGLHIWVKTVLPKPELCELCHVEKAYDLANRGTYNRELINWHWLCRRCHMTTDGRIERMIKTIEKFKADKKHTIKCILCGTLKKTHRADTRFCSKECLTRNGNNKRLGKPHV